MTEAILSILKRDDGSNSPTAVDVIYHREFEPSGRSVKSNLTTNEDDLLELAYYFQAIEASTLSRKLCLPNCIIHEMSEFAFGIIVECAAVCDVTSARLRGDDKTHGEKGRCLRCCSWRCDFHDNNGECGPTGHIETGNNDWNDDTGRIEWAVFGGLFGTQQAWQSQLNGGRYVAHASCCSVVGECQRCGKTICDHCEELLDREDDPNRIRRLCDCYGPLDHGILPDSPHSHVVVVQSMVNGHYWTSDYCWRCRRPLDRENLCAAHISTHTKSVFKYEQCRCMPRVSL